MNFLAHLFLSCERESLIVGNFMADFIRNRDLLALPGPVIEGVRLHRKIDSYTDNHPVVRQGMRRLYPYHSKYASVVIDIFYDYFLARNWELYTDRTLRAFMDETYRVLLQNKEIMPPFLRRRLQMMVEDDWLMFYTHLEGLEQTFRRLQRRVSKPELLENVTNTLLKYEEELDEEFQLFFPEVIAYVRNECLC
jgi:acyl carrier protein phosphodiesterase